MQCLGAGRIKRFVVIRWSEKVARNPRQERSGILVTFSKTDLVGSDGESLYFSSQYQNVKMTYRSFFGVSAVANESPWQGKKIPPGPQDIHQW
jgi:hypothetical protein